MRKFLLLLIAVVSFSFSGFSQNFSNKGKDFWVGYGNHIRMLQPGNQAEQMQIYLTSDVSTSGSVTFSSGSASIPYTITANQITVIDVPQRTSNYLPDEGLYTRGIHITALKDIVAYGFIYVNSVSGATLFLPTNTLGKEYYSVNYTQVSNEAPQSYSYFFVEAVEPGTTTVEITPTKLTKGGWPANTIHTVNLTQGQIYQVMATSDLTGSKVKSIASGNSGCKRIAFFCGSGKISIGCGSPGSSDNLYQQMYPASTWGKKYILIPSNSVPGNNLTPITTLPVINTNFFRVYRPDPTTIVTLNGAIIPSANFVNNTYDFSSNQTNIVDADKSILVAQYFSTAGCSGNNNPHDPEMIYLNPVEQTIDEVTLNSMQPASGTAIYQHHINVVLKNTGTSLASFKIDGISPPAAAFTVLPQDNSFSYIRIRKQGGSTTPSSPNLTVGAHRLTCDSGFNAIAYGFGPAESYGYSAGANLKDLITSYGTQSQYGTESGAVCTNSPFKFKISLAFQPDSIYWNLSGIINTPQYGIAKLLPISPATTLVPDSIRIVNGKNVYWYSLPNFYTFINVAVSTVPVTLFTANSDGCGSVQDKTFDLDVSAPPVANFVFTFPGCPGAPVTFTDQTVSVKPNYLWTWNFGDPASGALNTSSAENPIHIFVGPGPNYTVSMSTITTAGCFGSVQPTIVNVPQLANVTLTGSTTVCQFGSNPYLNFAITGGVAPYTINYTLSTNGGAPVPQTPLIISGTSLAYPVPTGIAGTFVYNITSIENANPAFCIRNITGQTATYVVKPLPTATITGTNYVCQGAAAQTLTFTGANGIAPYAFEYTLNGGANQTITTTSGNSATITIPTATVGTSSFDLVSVTDAAPSPCTNPVTGNATVIIQAKSSATIAGTASVCQGAVAPIITFTAANGNAPFIFKYNINGGATQTLVTNAPSTSATITVPMAVTGTFTYNLLSVENFGPTTCITTIIGQSAVVVINPLPTATISGDNTVCQNTGNYNITFTGAGGTAPYTFTYNINGGAPQTVTTTSGNSVNVPVSSATVGNFTYELTKVKDGTSTACFTTFTDPTNPGSFGPLAEFIVQATSSATIAGTASVCQDATAPVIIFTAANGIVPFTFKYNINGGATQTLVTSATSNSATITVPMTATGTFTYNLLSVQNTGPTTCITPISGQAAVVLINPNPTATITGSNIVCQNTGNYNITFTGAGGTAPYTFTYTINGSAPQTVTTSSGNSVTVTASSVAVGTFTYTLTKVKDASAGTLCTRDYTTANTAVFQVQATSTATIAGTATVCQDGTAPVITFTGANGIAPFTFEYNINGGATQSISSLVGNNSVTLPVPMVAGTFVYNLLSVKNTGPILCLTPITNASATAIIRPIPTATIAGTTTVCQNATAPTITFTGANATAPYTFTYTINGGAAQTVTSASNSATVNAPTGAFGTFVYALTQVKESSSTQCIKTYTNTTATIIVNQLATATISGTTTVCQASTAPEITFTATNGVAPYTFAYTLNGTALTVTTVVGNSVTVPVSTAIPGTYTYNLVSVTEASSTTCINNQAGSVNVIVHPKPTASYATTAPYCAQNAVTITPTFGITPTGSVTSWVWNYGDGTGQQIRPNGNVFTLTYPTAGVKPVSFKVVSDKGCESDLATTPAVIINSKPKAGFKNPESCLADTYADFADTSTVVGGTIVNWEWDFGDGTAIYSGGTTGPVNTHQNPRHAYLAVGQKTVKLIVTTNSGCKDTTTQVFFINGEVTSADFIPQGTFCSNRPVKIKENSVVNVGGLIQVDIYWDNATSPTVFERDDNPTPGKIYLHSYPNVQVDRTYSVRYIAYSGFNGVCQKEITKNIIVRASPVASFAPPIEVCLNGGNIQLVGTEIGGVGGTSTYIGTGVSTTGLFNPLTATPGIHNITFTAISPNGCDSALVRPIKVLIPPVANFTTVGNVCVGGPGNVNVVTFSQSSTVTAGQGGAIVKWIYDWGDGSPVQTFTTGANVTHAYATAGVKTAYLIVEDAFGCRNAAPGKALTFNVNPLPVPLYSFTSSACLPNANILFTNNTASQASNNYNWSFELPSTAAANVSTSNGNPTHIYTVLGPHNTKLVATNIATGCKDSLALVVNTIHPAPIVAFAPMADICLNNGTRTLTQGSETSGILGGPGIYSGPGVSASGVFNPLVAGVGTHTITYSWTSTFNCTTSITGTIKVLAAPVVNTFTTVGNVCERNDVTFANTTTSTAGTVTSWQYNWGDGSAIQTNPTGANTTHQYTAAGNNTATLSLVTDYGCVSSPPFPLVVNVNPIPRPNFTYSDTACLPVASILFKNTTPNIGNWIYNWNLDMPSTNPADNSVAVSNITHLYYTQAPHTVRLIATSVTTGCKDSIFKPIITIHPAPNASFAFTKPSVCLADFVGVIDQSTFADGTPNKWEWKWGDGATSVNANPGTHTYASAATYNVSLKITNNWGCIDDSIVPFTVHPFPVVNAGRDSVILQGGSLTLTPTVSGNDLTYLWTGTPGPINLSSTTVLNPLASPVEDITYKLTVTARGNCAASDFVFIKVLKDPVVPNTFTPNNDGVHDTWIIKYLESYPDNRIQVFTRAGQLVFESKRYLKPWDGTVNGKSLPIDTYYYILEPGSGRKPITGFVTIIK
jgi:gliding motility-associated-like protein